MKIKTTGFALALLTVSAGSQAIDLSTAGYVTYGDGNSYSLPLNGLEVKGSCGQISLKTKLGLQCNGLQGNINDGSMDDAYLTPSANTTDSFATPDDPDPLGKEGVWDQLDTWDATLAALDNSLDLDNNSMVFFFANNETGQEITDNLAAWARITLTDDSGAAPVVIGVWDLTNDDGLYGTVGDPNQNTGKIGGGTIQGDVGDYDANPDPSANQPTISVDAATGVVSSDFLQSGGNICANGLGIVVDCDNPYPYTMIPEIDAVAIDEEHNLGSNKAAYAVIFPELDAAIAGIVASGADLANYSMHVDLRLGCSTADNAGFPTVGQGGNVECDPNYALNGGAEKVWIDTQDAIVEIPTPGTLALFGLGLLGLSRVRARKAKS